MEGRLRSEALTVDLLREAKRIEFPDKVIAQLTGKDEEYIKTCVTKTASQLPSR